MEGEVAPWTGHANVGHKLSVSSHPGPSHSPTHLQYVAPSQVDHLTTSLTLTAAPASKSNSAIFNEFLCTALCRAVRPFYRPTATQAVSSTNVTAASSHPILVIDLCFGFQEQLSDLYRIPLRCPVQRGELSLTSTMSEISGRPRNCSQVSPCPSH